MANMPVYDLVGGKCREGARVYYSVRGPSPEAVGDAVQKLIDGGHTNMRVGLGGNPGASSVPDSLKPEGAPGGTYINPKQSAEDIIALFDYLRKRFGYGVEFHIDIHEKFSPTESILLSKALEPYRLYFLEDSLPPENLEWFERLRQQVSTPLAMGELFNNVNEYKTLISQRLIDYIRCHISQLGGFTPAKKLAVFCELYGVRTAWHGPGDLSPIGMAAQLHLDLNSTNFGIQEHRDYNDAIKEVFPGAPEVKGCYMYANGRPGWGVDFNEEAARKFPPIGYTRTGFMARLPDGTAVRS
jgi:mannonate dehydratase